MIHPIEEIADEDTLAGAMMLIAHYGECIRAAADDRGFPDLGETIRKTDRDLMESNFDLVRSTMGLDDSKRSRKAAIRFFAGLTDIVVEQGGNLEMGLHVVARPDEGDKFVIILAGDEAQTAKEMVDAAEAGEECQCPRCQARRAAS